MAKVTTITLDKIAHEIDPQNVKEADSLNPDNSWYRTEPVIVATTKAGELEIIDGFHRTAGMIRWCHRNDVAIAECEITVVLCDDDSDPAGDAACPGPKQERAINAIYVSAGLREADDEEEEEEEEEED